MASSVSKSIVDAPTLKKFINEVKTARKDIFAGDNLANTLMHHAAARNKPEFIRWMAEQGVGVNYVNKMLMTPLHMACMFGSNEAVEELIELGAEVNCSNAHGLTPLHYTCMRMNEPSTIKLLNNGANQHALSNNQLSPFKMSRNDFLTQLMYMTDQENIVHKLDQADTKPLVRARREFPFGEIPFSKSMTQTLIPGKMGRFDPYYRTSIEDEEVTIRVIHMPRINAVNREKFNDHLVEMKFADHLNILGIIGMVCVDANSVGVIIRSQSMPYLRELIEYNTGSEEMQMWLKVCVARDMIKATAHIYASVDQIERDFEISPDTIQVDAKKGVAFLEMVTRSSIEGLSHFALRPEFMAPERIVKGTVNYDLNNEHTYSIGALFHYMVKGGTFYPDQDAQSIAEKMCYHFKSQDEVYSKPIFAYKLNNDLMRSLTTVNLSHRVQVFILDETNVFSILEEKILEDDEFLRPFDGEEEELADTPASCHQSQSRSMHHDTDDEEEEEEEEEDDEEEEEDEEENENRDENEDENEDDNGDESDARSMNSRSSRKSQASNPRSERSQASELSRATPRVIRKSIESEYVSTHENSKGEANSSMSIRNSNRSSVREDDKRKSSNSQQSDAGSQRKSLTSHGDDQDDLDETDSSSSHSSGSAASNPKSRRHSQNDSEREAF